MKPELTLVMTMTILIFVAPAVSTKAQANIYIDIENFFKKLLHDGTVNAIALPL